MEYLKKFASVEDANAQGGGGLFSPNINIVSGLSAINFLKTDSKKLTCSFDAFGYAENVQPKQEGPSNDEIWYTSSNGNIVTPYTAGTGVFGANIVSNTYSGGKGIIKFDGNVTSIGTYAFNGCSGLTNITIPNSVTSIGHSAFYFASHLSCIAIPNSVTNIGVDAFGHCINLTSVTIPSSVTSIQSYAFLNVNCPLTYQGTISQWNLINKYYTGLYYTPTTHIVNCIDGTVNWNIISSCFLYGTQITLSDGTKKNVEDLTYDDTLRVWNADEGKIDSAPIVWLTSLGLMNDHYYKLTFSDGTVLKVTGQNSNHKMYNVDTRKFEGCAYAEIGDRIYSENGIVTLTNKEYIEEPVQYVNLITDQHINCFAEGILTSDRYGNTYPHDENMKYIKDEREIRPYSEFEAVGISRYWYDHLRLGEQTESLEETQKYIAKIEGQERTRE